MFLNKQFLFIFSLFLYSLTYGQKVTISGSIKDVNSNESLIGVTIYVEALQKGVVTNEYGFYSLNIPSGKHLINYSYLGYESKNIELEITSDVTQNVLLEEFQEKLEEVIIESTPKQISIKKPEMSVNKLSSRRSCIGF